MWIRAGLPAAVALLTAACFAGALGHQFVAFDDDVMLLRNPAWRGLSVEHLRWMLGATVSGHWHPLTWLSFAVDHAFWGMDPRGYHLTNVLLHAATAGAVYAALAALLAVALPTVPPARRRLAATGAALVWAVHPLRVESVAWVTERRDVLSGLLWVLAVLAYLRAHDAGVAAEARRRRLALALLALALSLLAKSWGMTFFAVLLVLDVVPLRRWHDAERTRVLLEKLPFAALGLGAAALVWRAVHVHLPELGQHGAGERLGQAAYGLCFYVWKTLWPSGLVPMVELRGRIVPFQWPWIGCIAGVAGVTALLVALRRRWPAGIAAWTAYAVILAPVLGITQAGPQLVADRYAYLATLPWTALLAAGLARLLAGDSATVRRATAAGLAVWIAALAVATRSQVAVWHDTVSLWTHAVAVEPGNAYARFSLGAALDEADRLDDARVHWRALADIVAAHPDDVPARAKLGLAEARLGMAAKHAGRPDEAREHLERAMALNPADGRIPINLGGLLLDQGRAADALPLFERGLSRTEDTAALRVQLGMAFLGSRAWPEAETMFRAAARLDPHDAEAAIYLGLALWEQGRRGEAVAAWQDALARDPHNPAATDLLNRAARNMRDAGGGTPGAAPGAGTPGGS